MKILRETGSWPHLCRTPRCVTHWTVYSWKHSEESHNQTQKTHDNAREARKARRSRRNERANTGQIHYEFRMSLRETHRQMNNFALLDGKHNGVHDEKGWLETRGVATARESKRGPRRKYVKNTMEPCLHGHQRATKIWAYYLGGRVKRDDWLIAASFWARMQ